MINKSENNFDPLQVKKEPLRDKRDRIRSEFKPKAVQYLFVGESVPYNGTFFYYKDSILFDYTLVAFKKVYPGIMQVNFLDRFKEMGFYLDDLCSEPVNQLKSKEEKKKRKRLRELYEEDLASRIKNYNPKLIIVTPKEITENIKSVIKQTGLDVPLKELPFPVGSQTNADNYVKELIEILKDINIKEQAMSLWTFWRYDAPEGDHYELRITDQNKMYLFHTMKDGKLIADHELEGETDDECITSGIKLIDVIMANSATINPMVESAIEGLNNVRKRMK